MAKVSPVIPLLLLLATHAAEGIPAPLHGTTCKSVIQQIAAEYESAKGCRLPEYLQIPKSISIDDPRDEMIQICNRNALWVFTVMNPLGRWLEIGNDERKIKISRFFGLQKYMPLMIYEKIKGGASAIDAFENDLRSAIESSSLGEDHGILAIVWIGSRGSPAEHHFVIQVLQRPQQREPHVVLYQSWVYTYSLHDWISREHVRIQSEGRTVSEEQDVFDNAKAKFGRLKEAPLSEFLGYLRQYNEQMVACEEHRLQRWTYFDQNNQPTKGCDWVAPHRKHYPHDVPKPQRPGEEVLPTVDKRHESVTAHSMLFGALPDYLIPKSHQMSYRISTWSDKNCVKNANDMDVFLFEDFPHFKDQMGQMRGYCKWLESLGKKRNIVTACRHATAEIRDRKSVV